MKLFPVEKLIIDKTPVSSDSWTGHNLNLCQVHLVSCVLLGCGLYTEDNVGNDSKYGSLSNFKRNIIGIDPFRLQQNVFDMIPTRKKPISKTSSFDA